MDFSQRIFTKKINFSQEPHLIDPSELLRPEPEFADKCVTKFRDYTIDENDPLKERVRQTYRLMHLNQTVNYVKGQYFVSILWRLWERCEGNKIIEQIIFTEKRRDWLKFDHFKASIREALELLNGLVDESDPDINLPNIIHAFQTAERARDEYPEHDWLHLIGLIHDLGKVMAFYGEPQYSVVGDTYPVGCLWSDKIVYRDDSFEGNVDANNPKYKWVEFEIAKKINFLIISIYSCSTKFGMYSPHCGLEKLMMSWGHDEYMYQVLKYNKSTLPPQAMNIIR